MIFYYTTLNNFERNYFSGRIDMQLSMFDLQHYRKHMLCQCIRGM
jgi:hypothetical protein